MLLRIKPIKVEIIDGRTVVTGELEQGRVIPTVANRMNGEVEQSYVIQSNGKWDQKDGLWKFPDGSMGVFSGTEGLGFCEWYNATDGRLVSRQFAIEGVNCAVGSLSQGQ